MQSSDLSDEDILSEAVRILESLGPFHPDTKRSAKWRTADQLATMISERCSRYVAPGRVEDLLQKQHLAAMKAIEAGQSPSALIRRAMRPDLTTTKQLWGSTRLLGSVWPNFPKDQRQQAPGKFLPKPNGPGNRPRVFLSHCLSDTELALNLGNDLVNLGIDVWMAEIHIEYGGDIVDNVREALHETDAVVGLVTRSFIASLWCRTELHTALSSAYASYLVIDTADADLVKAFECMEILPIHAGGHNGRFDESHIRCVGTQMKDEAAITDLEKYIERAQGFACNMPSYLGGRPAIGYPGCLTVWNGPFELISLQQMATELGESAIESGAKVF